MDGNEIASNNKRSMKKSTRGKQNKTNSVSIFKFKELFNCDFIEIVDESENAATGIDRGYSSSNIELPPETQENYDIFSSLKLAKRETGPDFSTVEPSEVEPTRKIIGNSSEQVTIEETPHYIISKPKTDTTKNEYTVIREYEVPDDTFSEHIIFDNNNKQCTEEIDFTIQNKEIDTFHDNNIEIVENISNVHEASFFKKRVKNLKSGRIYRCDSCDFQSKLRKDVERHTDRIHNTDYLKCSLCPYETKYWARLKSHLNKHDKHQDEILPLHNCQECDYQTTSIKYFKRHQKTVHGSINENNVFICKYCEFKTVYSFSMKTHVREKHQKLPNRLNKEKCYQCLHCEFQTPIKRCLIRHSKIHSELNEIRFFKCSYCSYQSNYRWNMKKHVLNVHKK